MTKTVKAETTFWNGEVAHVEVTPKKSIRIYGVRWANGPGAKAFDLTFEVGGMAVHGSYNLIYTGEIVGIGAKTVTIDDGFNRKKRLKFEDFVSRNWDYDAERIAAKNHETSMYI